MGAVSWEEDIAFMHAIKQRLGEVKIIAIGDCFAENSERLLVQHPVIDAILLNFTTDAILHYLSGDFASVNNMVIRDAQGKPLRTPDKTTKLYNLPVPLHDRFLKYDYRHPFIRKKKFATVLLDYGCPFPCSFCIMETLGFRTRSIEDVKEELRHLHKLGITEILFITQTFGADKKMAEDVCRFMIEEQFNFGWVCFSRVDVATPAMLAAMKQAGCHTIIFGIESGSEALLKKYRKGYTLRQILSTIDYCHSQDIETVGTFILGLPEETRETMQQTLDLLKIIKLDFASFNVAVPRAGTGLRQEALAEGLIKDDFMIMDQSGTEIAMRTKSLTQNEILQYRRKAVMTFYGRPGYFIDRIRKIKTPGHFIRQAKHGMSLLKKTYL